MKKTSQRRLTIGVILSVCLIGLIWLLKLITPETNPHQPTITAWNRPSFNPEATAIAINSAGTAVGRLPDGTPVLFTGHDRYEPLNLRGVSLIEIHDIAENGVVVATIGTDSQTWVCLINETTVFAVKWTDAEGSRSPAISPNGKYLTCLVQRRNQWQAVRVELSWEKGLVRMVRTQSLSIGEYSRAVCHDVNNLGYAVGTVFGENFAETYAAAWKPDGSLSLLPTPSGVVRSEALCLNRHMQVAGHLDGMPSRWDGIGVSVLPLPDQVLAARVAGIDDRGYILGTASLRRQYGEYQSQDNEYLHKEALVWPVDAERPVYTVNALIPNYGAFEMDSDGREEYDFRAAIALAPNGTALGKSFWGMNVTLATFVIQSPEGE